MGKSFKKKTELNNDKETYLVYSSPLTSKQVKIQAHLLSIPFITTTHFPFKDFYNFPNVVDLCMSVEAFRHSLDIVIYTFCMTVT